MGAALVMQYALTSSHFRVTDEPVPYIQVDLLITDPQNHQNLALRLKRIQPFLDSVCVCGKSL